MNSHVDFEYFAVSHADEQAAVVVCEADTDDAHVMYCAVILVGSNFHFVGGTHLICYVVVIADNTPC